jgi:hypothetical protein
MSKSLKEVERRHWVEAWLMTINRRVHEKCITANGTQILQVVDAQTNAVLMQSVYVQGASNRYYVREA